MQQYPTASTSSTATSSPSRGTSSIATSTPATSSTAMNGTASANGKERERIQSAESSLDGSMTALQLGGSGSNAGASVRRNVNGTSDGQQDDSGLLEWIYQRGFINGEFNDVQLHYRTGRAPLKFHALVISQSPALLQELRYAQQNPQSPLNIYFSLEEHDEISDEALQLSISYLYSPRALGHVGPSNAPAVLAAATLLQLPMLADHAFKMCRETIASIISPNEVKYWIALLERLEGKSNAAGTSNGNEYGRELHDDLMNRLTSTLPLSLHAFSSSAPQAQQAEAQLVLQHIYSALPFETFKAVLESPSLRTEEGESLSDQTRFGLAKKCILERKKLQASKENASNEEETVVLAFGGSGTGAGNVQVVRKPKQNRKLWKVNG